MTRPITYGSVCSGIEAVTVAMKPFGWKAEWFAENDAFPSSVLAHHYRHVPNLGNMTAIAAMVRERLIAAPDVLVGGTPCQAFSIAGLRAGLSDNRGALTLSFVELADAIDSTRSVCGDEPCVVWWENVVGVLSSKDNAFGCFLGALAGEDSPLEPPGEGWSNAGCVFGPVRTVAWRVCDAQYFGVAQRRRRVFVVASAREGFDPAEILLEFDGVRRDFAPSREAKEDLAGTVKASAGRRGGIQDETGLGLQPVAFGGANQAGPIDIATACRAHAGPHLDFESETFLVQSQAIAFDSRQDCISSTQVFGALSSSSPQAQAVVFDTTQITSPGNYSNPQPGDPCHPLAAGAHPPAVCVTGDITHTLKAEGFDASEDGTGRGQPIVATVDVCPTLRAGGNQTGGDRPPGSDVDTVESLLTNGMAVRRLTPRECERLQAFDDDYTKVPVSLVRHRKTCERYGEVDVVAPALVRAECGCKARHVTAEDCPDGPRYKACGNSMCVYNMRWIGRRITRTLHALALRAA